MYKIAFIMKFVIYVLLQLKFEKKKPNLILKKNNNHYTKYGMLNIILLYNIYGIFFKINCCLKLSISKLNKRADDAVS